MARANYFIVAENTAPSYVITCERDVNGTLSPIDLSGASVKVILQQKSTGTVTNPTNTAASITSDTGGVISWTAISTDFPAKGIYIADVKVTYNGGGIEILRNQAKWDVRAKIPYTSASLSPSASASPSA